MPRTQGHTHEKKDKGMKFRIGSGGKRQQGKQPKIKGKNGKKK